MKFPKERRENLIWRNNILRKAANDEVFKAEMKELFHRDILFAFNAFYYTYDVRKRPYHQIPFMTWEYQDEAILEILHQIKTGEDLVVEKTRDMGLSWLVILVFHHQWIDPVGGGDFLLGSRIEDYVDRRGDMRTLLEKVRYAHYKLPRWLWPKEFNPRKHDNYLKFQNPETGATISGESNNPNFGTGGRYAAILFDEFAKWESTDEAAWTSAGDATPCRIAVSTAFGAGGQYYKLVTNGKTKKLTLHWSLHPEKALGLSCIWPPPNEDQKKSLGTLWSPEVILTSPWREKEGERRSEREIAQEIEINYLGSGNPVFDGKSAESLQVYMKLPDIPLYYLKLDIDELTYEKQNSYRFSREGLAAVYEEFDSTHCYTVGVDVVEGLEDGDYAIITIVDRITKNVVCAYHSRLDEILLARALKILVDFYSPEPESAFAPWVGIETNGPGLATFDKAVELGMTNLFMAPRYDVTNGSVSYKKGWRTDATSKRELIAGIKNYLIYRIGKLNNQRLIGEMLSFIHTKTGKTEAKSGAHDDEVIAFGIALQVDELAPIDLGETKKARAVFLEDRIKEEPEKVIELTVQERCLAQALAQRELRSKQTYGEVYGSYL